MTGVILVRSEQVGKEVAHAVHEADIGMAGSARGAGRSWQSKVGAVGTNLHIVGGKPAGNQLLPCLFCMIVGIEYAYDCLFHGYAPQVDFVPMQCLRDCFVVACL